MHDRQNARDVYPPTGPELNAKSWQTEAPLRTDTDPGAMPQSLAKALATDDGRLRC